MVVKYVNKNGDMWVTSVDSLMVRRMRLDQDTVDKLNAELTKDTGLSLKVEDPYLLSSLQKLVDWDAPIYIHLDKKFAKGNFTAVFITDSGREPQVHMFNKHVWLMNDKGSTVEKIA